jgi:hypothetical protein
MGVEAAAVLTPVSDAQRAGLRRIESVSLPAGGVQGSGTSFSINHDANAGFRLVNQALAGGATAVISKSEFIVTGEHVADLARAGSLTLKAVAKAPADAVTLKKPRLGLYRSWQPMIDEGWTRWILEDFGFAPVTLRNGDVRADHLRERFDAILLPDSSQRSMMDGYAVGAVPGEFSGGLGDAGASALRDFVRDGGTLIAFNNASLFAIDQFHLPVANVLANLTPDQFYCSGSLLQVELTDTAHPAVSGLPRNPIVMFELGPAFETRTGFRGNVLASYPKDSNSLASGYLLHPERIQGKAAAIEAFYGEGRIYLFGFRPQWRGQSHGTYKFFFNAIYDSPASAKPTAAPPAAAARGPADPWRAVVALVLADLGTLLQLNRAFFAARGQAAVEERDKLNAAADRFEKDRIQEVQDSATGMDEASRKKSGELVRAMRRAAADLRVKEIEAGVDVSALAQRYKIE